MKEDDEVLEKDWEYVDKDNVDEIEDFVREYIDDGCEIPQQMLDENIRVDYMVKTEQTVTAKTAMLLQF